MVYWKFVKEFKPYKNENDDVIDVEEQIAEFDTKIGQAKNPETDAQKMVRAMLIAQGKDPDAQEMSPELKARIEQDAMRSDEELFFSGALHSGKELKGRKIKPSESRIDD